ncbi:MAG: 1-phosphofructokinase [Lachnospiraceae bacterium]|nr:1-phosphofructokinase [Lachnospiraceae bacterium]
MVYTLTFNPSLDYIVSVNHFMEGKVNRTSSERIVPGGKGINVSIVLANLGVQSIVLGFVAGFTGDEIERQLKKSGLLTRFIDVKNGLSRINVKMKNEMEQQEKNHKMNLIESEINGSGPLIGEEEMRQLMEILSELSKEDLLVISGSIPQTSKDSIYMDIMKKLGENQAKIVVDATGQLLINTLRYHPFLIKPNQDEMEEIFGVKMKDEETLIQYGRKLKEKGAKNVLISRAEKGAVLICEDGNVLVCKAPEGKAVNSVGAGDSMVAGFIAGYLKSGDEGYALKMGIAAGSASAFSENLATKEKVEKVFKKMGEFVCRE